MLNVTPTITALRDERRRHEKEIARIDGTISALESYRDEKRAEKKAKDRIVMKYTPSKAKAAKPARKSANAGIFPTAHKIVAEAPKPIGAGELHVALQKNGYKVDKTYASVILSQMTKREKFARAGVGKYVALSPPPDVSQSSAT